MLVATQCTYREGQREGGFVGPEAGRGDGSSLKSIAIRVEEETSKPTFWEWESLGLRVRVVFASHRVQAARLTLPV
jgi:hypothetical protein